MSGGSAVIGKDTTLDEASDLFRSTVDLYIDANKPDQQCVKQMKSWDMQCKSLKFGKDTVKTDEDIELITFKPKHQYSCTLHWSSEYIVLKLDFYCAWRSSKECDDLYYNCTISSEFTNDSSSDDNKTHKRMIERLQKDDYIKMLQQSSQPLVQAILHSGTERTNCEQATATAIRRALFRTAQDNLDVFDLVVSFPVLPQIKLAQRARLRLLEDATCDACEEEEEEERMGELSIQQPKRQRVEAE